MDQQKRYARLSLHRGEWDTRFLRLAVARVSKEQGEYEREHSENLVANVASDARFSVILSSRESELSTVVIPSNAMKTRTKRLFCCACFLFPYRPVYTPLRSCLRRVFWFQSVAHPLQTGSLEQLSSEGKLTCR